MGTFLGHAVPGTFFIMFSLWWTIQIFHRYYRSLKKNGEPFKSSVTFPCCCLCGWLKNFEAEGLAKVAFTVVGFTGEVITGFHEGKFEYMGNGQHATMFFFFGMSGIIDILVHHKIPIPKGIEYIMLTLAFAVAAILFRFHLHGRTDLDILIHTLLMYVVYACVIACLVEMRYRKSVLAVLARAFFVFIQGTWFWQTGFVLYNPLHGAKSWEDEHDNMMIVSMMFAWHVAAVTIIMLIIGGIIGCIHRCQGEFYPRHSYDSLNMQLIKKDLNGQTIVNLNDESESDIEFERPLDRSEQ